MSKYIRELSPFEISVCGLGTVGANVALGLVRSGAQKLRVIDDQIVTMESLIHPPFGWADIGEFRSKAISRELVRTRDILPDAVGFRVKEHNVSHFLEGAQIVIDTFLDEQSECISEYCLNHGIPCLRVRVTKDRVDLIWNESNRF